MLCRRLTFRHRFAPPVALGCGPQLAEGSADRALFLAGGIKPHVTERWCDPNHNDDATSPVDAQTN